MKAKYLLFLFICSLVASCNKNGACQDEVSGSLDPAYYAYGILPFTGNDTLKYLKNGNHIVKLIGNGFEEGYDKEFKRDCGSGNYLLPYKAISFKSDSFKFQLKYIADFIGGCNFKININNNIENILVDIRKINAPSPSLTLNVNDTTYNNVSYQYLGNVIDSFYGMFYKTGIGPLKIKYYGDTYELIK